MKGSFEACGWRLEQTCPCREEEPDESDAGAAIGVNRNLSNLHCNLPNR